MSKQLTTTLKTYDDVDESLFRLGRIEADLKKNEAEMNKELANIEKKYDDKTKELKEEKLSLEANVEAFCKLNKRDFTSKGKTKTKKLTFGVIRFKMNPGAIVLIRKVKNGMKKAAIDLKDMFATRYVRVEYSVNKEKLLEEYRSGKIGDMELASVNLRIDKDDQFNYSINWKEIEKKEKVAS